MKFCQYGFDKSTYDQNLVNIVKRKRWLSPKNLKILAVIGNNCNENTERIIKIR
jgi:hypothetical protein